MNPNSQPLSSSAAPSCRHCVSERGLPVASSWKQREAFYALVDKQVALICEKRGIERP